MAKKIAATLNLTQALEDFHRTVVPLLEIGEVEQWNGETLRQRELKIREAAYQRGKRNPKTQRRSYNAEWKEPKLLTIYTVDEQGKKIKTKEIPITNDGTFGNFFGVPEDSRNASGQIRNCASPRNFIYCRWTRLDVEGDSPVTETLGLSH
ncbi:MAG: hypothetical protein QNJ34_05120 [Xenococcaceae cyanobacterium MO_188.B29]|nr:hypothetical protein [Xenococcaceae cyanobacterium MO_188.B29]